MADALDSKSSDRKVVWVQVPPPVLLSAQSFTSTVEDAFLQPKSSAGDKPGTGLL